MSLLWKVNLLLIHPSPLPSIGRTGKMGRGLSGGKKSLWEEQVLLGLSKGLKMRGISTC
jgi:hypothetical protein